MSDMKEALLSMCATDAKSAKKVCSIADLMKKVISESRDEFSPSRLLRASQAFDTCTREFVFRNLLPTPPDSDTKGNVSMVMRMTLGSMLHWHFQNMILGPAGVLWGTWVRKSPDGVLAMSTGFRPEGPLPDFSDPESIATCWTYREIYVNDKGLSGHVDGVIDLLRVQAVLDGGPLPDYEMPTGAGGGFVPTDPERFVLLEIKTTDDNVLRMVKSDEEKYLSDGYKCQATIYQRLLGFKKTLFIYVDRKYFQFHGFEYAGEDKFWRQSLDKIDEIDGSFREKALPPRHLDCPFRSSKRAKACQFVDVCFSDGPDLVFSVMEEMGEVLPVDPA